jgi:hypothetical protein
MISIKREMNLSDIEILYKKYRSESIGTKVDLELPNDFKEESIGVLPSLIQFISNIIRDDKLNQLKSKLNDSSERGSLLHAAKSYLWYVCSSLHWLNEFTYKDGQSLKPDIKTVNQDINELMRNYRPLGHSFMLTCYDHLPKNKGLMKMFYQPPNFLMVDEDMTEQYVNQIIKNLGEKTNKSVFGQLQSILKPITAIIYELFKNTDDWATKDRFGNKIEPSVRGVYFRYYKNFQKNITQYCEGNQSLNTYFSHDIYKPDSENKISFLEITVFDCGDGFAGKRLTNNYDENLQVNQEVGIVKQCLTKYWTNEEGKKGIVKGIGLDRVLTTIDQKGFLRIRTNKAHIYRDMVIDRYESESNSENIKLYDWVTGSEHSYTSHYNAKGSVITIVLPLDAALYNPNKTA